MADARNAVAADRLYHPYWRHAANFLGVAFALVFGATTTWLMGWDERLTLALFAVAATPALVSLLIASMSFVTDRRLRRLLQEDAVFSWRYDDAEWANYLSRNQRDSRRAGPAVTAAMLFIGFIFSGMAHLDGQRYFGSSLNTWLLPCGIGALVGAAAWALIRWNQDATRRRMRKLGGRFLLGPSGFYITGQFRPLSGYGQTLTELRIDAGEPNDLVFRYSVNAGRYSDEQEVRIPVPQGRLKEVQETLEQLETSAAAS